VHTPLSWYRKPPSAHSSHLATSAFFDISYRQQSQYSLKKSCFPNVIPINYSTFVDLPPTSATRHAVLPTRAVRDCIIDRSRCCGDCNQRVQETGIQASNMGHGFQRRKRCLVTRLLPCRLEC
jgi:hypothetical protein